MALPSDGLIRAQDINLELNRSFNALFRIGGSEERALAQVPSGVIKFSDFYEKSSLPGTTQQFNITCGLASGGNVGYANYLTVGTPYGSISPETVGPYTVAISSINNISNIIYVALVGEGRSQDTIVQIRDITNGQTYTAAQVTNFNANWFGSTYWEWNAVTVAGWVNGANINFEITAQ